MDLRQACTLIGAILFMSGLSRHFHIWAGPHDGIIVWILVIAALVLAWRELYRWLWLVSFAAMGSLAYTVITFQANMKRVQLEQNIQTRELVTIDWAIPLAGIVLIIVATLLKTPPSIQDENKVENQILTKLKQIFSAVSVFLPLVVINLYPLLQEAGVATAIYGLSVALAASFMETDFSKRLLFSAPVVILGFMCCATYDAIMIMGIACVAGASSVGYMPVFIRSKWWKNLLYRFIRMTIAWWMLILTAVLHLPRSGRCPGGGGDITETSITFTIITYFPILGMIVMDSISKYADQQFKKLAIEQNHDKNADEDASYDIF